MQHVYEPEESGVHVTAGEAADDSGVGCADLCTERNRVCVDWAAIAICDGADWRYESHGPTGVWSRFQP
jgi:hypothetical protein